MQYFIKDLKAATCELRSTRTLSAVDQPFPEPLSRDESIKLLEQSLSLVSAKDVNPGNTSCPPIIFLSIDVEGTDIITELGISIFHTDDLLSSTMLTKSSISSYNFLMSYKENGGTKFRKPFIFGTSEIVPRRHFKQLFQFLSKGRRVLNFGEFEEGESSSTPLYRREDAQLIVVGHNVKNDMLVIEKHYPGFWRSLNPTSVINLDVVWKNKASDGNDANFTLRAVLLSAIRHTDVLENQGRLTRDMVDRVRAIALDHVPDVRRSSRRGNGKRGKATGKRRRVKTLKELHKKDLDGCWTRIDCLDKALDGLPDGWIKSMYET